MKRGQMVVWAPSKLVLDAVDGPQGARPGGAGAVAGGDDGGRRAGRSRRCYSSGRKPRAGRAGLSRPSCQAVALRPNHEAMDYFRPIADDRSRPPGGGPAAGRGLVLVRPGRGAGARRAAAADRRRPIWPARRWTALTAPRAGFAGLAMDRPRLMGILNVTPDSFSDGGRFLAPASGAGAGAARWPSGGRHPRHRRRKHPARRGRGAGGRGDRPHRPGDRGAARRRAWRRRSPSTPARRRWPRRRWRPGRASSTTCRRWRFDPALAAAGGAGRACRWS